MQLIRTNGFPTLWADFPSSLSRFDDWMDDMYNSWPTNTAGRVGVTTPAVNIREEEQAWALELAAPGMDRKDFKLEVADGALRISCEKEDQKERKEGNFTRREFSYRSFARSFTLPENVNADAIAAKYDKGILKLTIPKKTTSKVTKAKAIPVS